VQASVAAPASVAVQSAVAGQPGMPGAPADRAHDDPLAALLARSVRARGPVLARAYLPPVDAFKAEAKLKGVNATRRSSRSSRA